MHYGFYEELDSLLEDYEDSDFGFLENINMPCEDSVGVFDTKINRHINAYDFLHGCCNEFAYMLNEKYGYPIYEIVDHTGTLIHSFARLDQNNIHYFIDVRGITTDYHEFISEFEDWTDEETSIEDTFSVDLLNKSVREKNTPIKKIGNLLKNSFLTMVIITVLFLSI